MTLEIHDTKCCALAQLSGGDGDGVGEIIRVVKGMTREAGHRWNPTIWGGQRTLFAISVHPLEPKWEANLLAAGFEEKFRFPRRNGYPDHAELIFWLKVLIPDTQAGHRPHDLDEAPHHG